MSFQDEAEQVAKRHGWKTQRVEDHSTGPWLSVVVSGDMAGAEDSVRVSIWHERSWLVTVSAHACTVGHLASLSNLAAMAVAVLGCKPKAAADHLAPVSDDL